ncbi:PEGA domain-containing protein [Methanoregula sp.]|uniref:PEGA domain-containing protein n=1 Tax=Methanoregula sp. TaxID=2052170 RepID=UPI002BDBA94C|nr:PEGA domain-containing protein [Methanoregula sp.]HVP95857.1 PEGA domain-containing protein [Methanoregula sp.]
MEPLAACKKSRPAPVCRVIWAGLLLCVLLAGAVSAGSIQSYIGDTVKLSGYCYTSQTVYLFLTGPNLPANGVALDNINYPADQGGFTQVSVDSNNHWEYDWGTGATGGRLDAGTYTVWAVDGPNSLANLNEAQYSTISVTLSSPGIGYVTASSSPPGSAITTPVEAVPGILNVSSVPEDASVVVNGNYQGRSPISIPGLAPGTYLVNVSRFNYETLSTSATVEEGATTEMTATLRPKTGSLAINTSPEGANITLDGTAAGISPVTLNGIAAGNHTVNATLAGYVPFETEVTVIADQPVTTTIVLSRPASLIPEIPTPLPVPVTLGACIAAGLLFVLIRPRSGA